MKKILFVLLFGVILAFNSENLSAQELSIEAYAEKQATALQEQFGLSESQKSAVYRAFYSRKLNYNKHLIGHENEAGYQQNKEKFDNSFNHILKRTLGEENYNTYLAQQTAN